MKKLLAILTISLFSCTEPEGVYFEPIETPTTEATVKPGGEH